MSIASVRSEITNCSNKINDCNAQVRSLEELIENQIRALNSFRENRWELEEFRAKRILKVNVMSGLSATNRIAKRYSEGMSDLLTGKRAETTEQKFDSTEDAMLLEIRNNENKIHELQIEINGLRQRRDYLYEKLHHLQQKANTSS